MDPEKPQYNPEAEKGFEDFGPGFNISQIRGLFRVRGENKGLAVHHNTFNEPGQDARKVLEDIIQNIRFLENAEKSASYFPNNFIADLQSRLGPQGLRSLFKILKEKEIEWGVQLTPETISPELAREMREAGCSYVALEADSANTELLSAAGQKATLEDLRKAIEILDREDIRIGMNLVFGIKGRAKKGFQAPPETEFTTEVAETRQSADRSIDFIRDRLKEGRNIVRVNFSLFEDLSAASPETKKGYPWNRFLNGETGRGITLDENLTKHIIEKGVREVGEVLDGQDLYMVGEIYDRARKPLAPFFLELGSASSFVDFNHAALTTPKINEGQRQYISQAFLTPPRIMDQARRSDHPLVWPDEKRMMSPSFALENAGHLLQKITDQARAYLACAMGVKDKGKASPRFGRLGVDHIALAPNTTTAINYAVAAVAINKDLFAEPGKKHLSEERGNIVISDAEHDSIRSLPVVIRDSSNVNARRASSTFQDFGKNSPYTHSESQGSHPLDVEVRTAEVLRTEAGRNILGQIDANTKLVIFSHVIRDTGLILDVKKLCGQIRERSPNAWILVDGAQALGALPNFNVEDLGCDFYVATPHKTMNSLPFGTMYMSDRGMQAAAKLVNWAGTGRLKMAVPALSFSMGLTVKSGTGFHSSEVDRNGIISPVEPRSFCANFDPGIQFTDHYPNGLEQEKKIFSTQGLPEEKIIPEKLEVAEAKRKELKARAIESLTSAFGGKVEILSPQDDKHSNFILSFRFPGHDNRQIVERLWKEHHIGETYIARSDLIRISFSPFNTKEEIDKFVSALRALV